MGSIYLRGKTWWIQYYRSGKPYRESAKTKKKMVANELLKQREGDISKGEIPGIHFDRVTFNELAEGLISNYEINNKKTTNRAKQCVTHLKETFEGMKVVNIDTPGIERYIKERLGTGVKSATINRELSALKRMLNLGARQTPPKVNRVPYVPMLKENNTRKGFFEHAEFLALKDVLPDYLKGLASFGYKIGWRISEVCNLTWGQVDRDQGIVRLEVGETKNDEGRTVYLDDELKQIFADQWEKRKQNAVLTPYVFTNEDGTNKVKEFRKTWNQACRATGLGYGYRTSRAYVKKWEDKFNAGPTFHDFRRSSVRNMVRSGTPERVVMMISGHKTRSVFDRYNITNATDLKLAAQRQEAYLKSQIDTNLSTIAHLEQKKDSLNEANPLK